MNNFIFDPSYRKEERLDFRLWIFRSNIPRPLEARRPPVRWHCKNQRLTPKIRKKWKWNRTLQLFASSAAGKQLNKLWEKTSSTEDFGNGKLKVKRDLFELFSDFVNSWFTTFFCTPHSIFRYDDIFGILGIPGGQIRAAAYPDLGQRFPVVLWTSNQLRPHLRLGPLSSFSGRVFHRRDSPGKSPPRWHGRRSK